MTIDESLQEKKFVKWQIVLFMIWPFASFLLALKKYHLKSAQYFILSFFFLYGFTFSIDIEGADSTKYVERFVLAAESDFGTFFSEKQKDYLIPIFNFILSRFTRNGHILYGFYALFFGFFYLKSILGLLNDRELRKNINTLILIVGFASTIALHNINGIRFWSASWVFFYGAYHYLISGKNRYLFWVFFSAFIHFSFLFPIGIFIAFIFIGVRNYIYVPFLAASFIIPILIDMQSIIMDYSAYISSDIEQRAGGYLEDSYLAKRAEEASQRRWFLVWKNAGILYYLYLAILYIRINFLRKLNDKRTLKLFSFLLFFLSFINLVRDVPSFGGRFLVLWFVFAFAFLYRVYGDAEMRFRKINFISFIGVLPILLYIIVDFRISSITMNIFLFLSNPLMLFFNELELTIYQLIFE